MYYNALFSALVAVGLFTAQSACSPFYKPPRATKTLTLQQPDNTLPPPVGLALKYVLLGLGTQNYTCATPGSTAAPGSTGALGEV
jgi:hypothetical protein